MTILWSGPGRMFVLVANELWEVTKYGARKQSCEFYSYVDLVWLHDSWYWHDGTGAIRITLR